MSKIRNSLGSFVLLSVLLVISAFVLSGCGFFNQAPVAQISTTPAASGETLTIEVGQKIDFDAGSSNPNGGEITDYEWDFQSSPNRESIPGSGKTPSHTYTVTGTYTVKLTVTDDSGRSDSTTMKVEVIDITASFTMNPSLAKVGETVNFDASGSSGNIDSYNWEFNSSSASSPTASGLTVTHSYSEAGTYQVKLTVSGQSGISDSTTKSIKVSSEDNDPPSAEIEADTTSGQAPLEVQFNAGDSSDPDGSIVDYRWDFDDGNTGSGKQITHTFNEEKTTTKEYTVTLTVTDDDGATATDGIEILTIVPPPPPG